MLVRLSYARIRSSGEKPGRDSLFADGAPAARSRDPAKGPELGAERGDEVRGVVGVLGEDEVVIVLLLGRVGSHCGRGLG